MKKLMISVGLMVPLMACASLFSERSGEIFQATREGPGELSLGLIYVGLIIPPIGLATVPAGIAVGAVDELVVSPVADLCCLPYDLAQPQAAYRQTIRIEAVGKGNGFLRDTCNWYDGMPGAYQIPAGARFEDQLVPAVYCWQWDGGGSTGTKGFDESTYYCLRLRTRLAEDGSVIGAHYGKLFFHHGIGSFAQTLFVCAENELWLE